MGIDLNYIAPDDHTGYGVAAAQYIRHLREAGCRVSFQPLRPGSGLGLWYECVASPIHAPALQTDADSILHVVPEYYPALIRRLRASGVHGRVIAMTTWEASRLQVHWPPLLNAMDAVIVPSEWNREIFLASGVTSPIHVLPHISEFGGRMPALACATPVLTSVRRATTRTVFYSIGTQIHRKGNDLLIAAFQLAFPGRDDVQLVLKTSPGNLEPSQSRKVRAIMDLLGWDPLTRVAKKDPRILLIRKSLTTGEMAALHALGDCYVTCTRGEGWGIGLFEAMMFGKPAIAPSHGGHRVFFEEGSSNLVSSRLVAAQPKHKPRYAPQEVSWVETDVPAMAKRMQDVDAQLDASKQEAARTAETMRARFHPEVITRHLNAILEHTRISNTTRSREEVDL